MAYAVAQHADGSGSGTALSTAKNAGSSLTNGNLVIAHVFTGNGTTEATYTFNEDPTNASKWFFIDRAIDPTGNNLTITTLGWYVTGSPGTLLPAFCTSGSGFHAWAIQEISGVTGTWATDYLGSSFRQIKSLAASIKTPKRRTVANGSFGVAAWSKYNESSSGTAPSGWTSDVNTVNGGNYGSYGCGHQAIATAGTDTDATWTPASSNNNTMAVLTVFLTPSQPTVPYLVRTSRKINISSSIPGTQTFGGRPHTGNLIVAHLAWKDGSVSSPTIGGSWTDYKDALNGSNPIMLGLYRYQAGGDTRTQPALATVGATFWAASLYEFSGVTGTFASDHVSSKSAYQSTGSGLSTTTDTTTANNQVCITTIAEYAGSISAAASLTSGGNLEDSWADSTDYGNLAESWDIEASSGSTVGTVWVLGGSTNKSGYIQSIFGMTSISATGSGGIGTETETAPTGTGGASSSGSGAVGTETEAAPTGEGHAGTTGGGSIGTETETAPTGSGESINVAQGEIGTETETAPEADAFGSGSPIATTQVILEALFTEGTTAVRTTELSLRVLFTEQTVEIGGTGVNVSTFIQETIVPSTDGTLEEAFPCPWPPPNP